MAGQSNNRVQKFGISGNYMFQYGGKGSRLGQLNGSRSVTVHDGRLYIADHENHRISVFQVVGGLFCCIIGEGKVDYPYDVAVTVNDQLLVAEYRYESSCVHTFTLGGDYITRIGTPGSGVGQLCNPCGIAVDFNGFIFIAEHANNQVSILACITLGPMEKEMVSFYTVME